MIYDPQDFSAPLASNDVTIPHCHSGGVEVFGNNIIIAKGNAVYEMNPETCEFVGEPYKASDSIGHEIDVLVHEGSIYLAEYVGGERLEIMDKLGNVTGRVDDFNPSMISSSGSIYFKASIYNGSSRVPGIFRMNHNEVKNRILTSNDLFTNSNYATKVVSGEILSFCPDGEGGCYYVPADGTIAEGWGNEYIGHSVCHWDGIKSTEVYSSDTECGHVGYDPASRILFLMQGHTHDDGVNDVDCLRQDSSGQFKIFQTFSGIGDAALISKTPSSPEDTLPSAVIEPVTPGDDVLENLAELVSIDKSQVKLITQENISSPQEPTQNTKKYIHDDGYEATYKLNTLTVSEDGYYVFLVNIPDEFVGKKVSDIKLYAMENKDNAEVSPSFVSIINGILNYGEITNLLGIKIDTLEGQMLAIGFLQAGTPFSVYLAKILLAILAGGCNSFFGFIALGAIALTVLRIH